MPAIVQSLLMGLFVCVCVWESMSTVSGGYMGWGCIYRTLSEMSLQSIDCTIYPQHTVQTSQALKHKWSFSADVRHCETEVKICLQLYRWYLGCNFLRAELKALMQKDF